MGGRDRHAVHLPGAGALLIGYQGPQGSFRITFIPSSDPMPIPSVTYRCPLVHAVT